MIVSPIATIRVTTGGNVHRVTLGGIDAFRRRREYDPKAKLVTECDQHLLRPRVTQKALDCLYCVRGTALPDVTDQHLGISLP